MKNHILPASLFVAMSIAGCGGLPPTELPPKLEPSIPASARLRAIRTAVAVGARIVNKKVYVASSTSEYYPFPLFNIESAMFTARESTPEPLIDIDGRVARVNYEGKNTITVIVRDLLNTELQNAVLQALKVSIDPAVQGKSLAYPALSPDWKARLEVRDNELGGEYIQLGSTWNFSTDTEADSLRMTFAFVGRGGSERAAKLFMYAKSDDLQLTLTGTYVAKYTTPIFQVTGQFMDEQSATIANKVSSSPGGKQAILFIPVGGNATEDFDFSRLFERSILFSLERNATARDSSTDSDLIHFFLSRSFDQFQEKIKWEDQAESSVVSFLLSSGVRITTTVGQTKAVVDNLLKERERKTHDLLEQTSKYQTVVDVAGSASVDVLGIFGGSASVATHYDTLSEEGKKQVRDKYERDLEKLEKTVNGSYPTVVAMKLDQLNKLKAGGHFKSMLESSTFTMGRKDIDIRLVFDSSAIPDATKAFCNAIRDIVSLEVANFASARSIGIPGFSEMPHIYQDPDRNATVTSYSGTASENSVRYTDLAARLGICLQSIGGGWTESKNGNAYSYTRGRGSPTIGIWKSISGANQAISLMFRWD